MKIAFSDSMVSDLGRVPTFKGGVYLPLFPYQAWLSPIQTDWPAWSSTFCGLNIEAASLPASL